MSLRQRFFSAMRRQNDSYIPFEFSLCPALKEEFTRRTGTDDYAGYFNFPTRNISVECIRKGNPFSGYYDDTSEISINYWGVGHRKGSVAHFTKMAHPMERFEKIEEFMAYPYPDNMDEYKWDIIPQKVKAIQESDLIAVASMEWTIFEIAWYLRGMDNFMMDMVLNPDLANAHLDRITAIRCESAKRYAAAGCDVLRLGDDVSTQLSMMINPELWREFIKPRLARVISTAKGVNPELLIFYHGDGNLIKIIPDLIEIGIDILNPIQPECMDPVEIKNKYGNRLSLWGTLGTQTTMPFGSPEEVVKVCERMIREAGKGGGLLLAPTHMLEPEVPWENIEAFINTVKRYNQL